MANTPKPSLRETASSISLAEPNPGVVLRAGPLPVRNLSVIKFFNSSNDLLAGPLYRPPVIVAKGPCHTMPPMLFDGNYFPIPEDAADPGNGGINVSLWKLMWDPDDTDTVTNGAHRQPPELLAALRRRYHARTNRTTDSVRLRFIGDSIARYLMCFTANLILRYYITEENSFWFEPCKPNLFRGALYMVWPQSPALLARSPFVFDYIMDNYFPEYHVSSNLLEIDELHDGKGLPPVVSIVVSRGTWDSWIRFPRRPVGANVFFGFSEGLLWLRRRHPNAAIAVYGMSKQYPSRFHRPAERCAMHLSLSQIRALLYAAVRRVNALVALRRYTATPERMFDAGFGSHHRWTSDDDAADDPLLVQYFDFYALTAKDNQWYYHTVKHDGMHFAGPQSVFFPKNYVRLLYYQSAEDGRGVRERFTPPPLPAECSAKHLPLNPMPVPRHRHSMSKVPPGYFDVKHPMVCQRYVGSKSSYIDFGKVVTYKHANDASDADKIIDCLNFYKLTTQRLGCLDFHWLSAFFRERLRTVDTMLYNISASVKRWTAMQLWDRVVNESTLCAEREATLTPRLVEDLLGMVKAKELSCTSVAILRLRALPEVAARLRIPSLAQLNCSFFRVASIERKEGRDERQLLRHKQRLDGQAHPEAERGERTEGNPSEPPRHEDETN
jgi:hypothetical protein